MNTGNLANVAIQLISKNNININKSDNDIDYDRTTHVPENVFNLFNDCKIDFILTLHT